MVKKKEKKEKKNKSHGVKSRLYGGCSDGVPPINFFQAEHRIKFISRPMEFLGFSNHENGAPKQEISKLSTVCCSTFSRSWWSVVRSTSLANGGTSKQNKAVAFLTWRNFEHCHRSTNCCASQGRGIE
jgi:hypothetical protein